MRSIIIAMILLFLGAVVVVAFGRDYFLRSAAAGAAPTVAVSQDAAASAERKLEMLMREGVEVRLDESELTSLFHFRSDIVGAGLAEGMEVRLRDSMVQLAGTVPADRLPEVAELETLRMILPDTVPILVGGGVNSIEGGLVALQITSLEVLGMPIPARLHPTILDRLGRRDHPGLPASALALPLPGGIASVRVENGELVLTPR
jgi:hypothetical protein